MRSAHAKPILPDLTELAAVAGGHHASGHTVVFTNGCFDILHAGHIHSLEAAAGLGDVLIVAVNSDEGVRRLKGPKRPLNCLADRLTLLAALRCVSYVVAFDEDWPEALILAARPDVYVKGADYTAETLRETPLVESLGGRVTILPMLPGRSTSSLIHSVACRR